MLLFAFKVAMPEYVHLNRGNHEDRMLASVYGFKNECIAKTNEPTFGAICKVFPLIPLACIVESVGFVVHGGLSSMQDASIEDINAIPRHKWDTVSQAGITLESLSETERGHFLLMKDLLWSDIDPSVKGTTQNPRGAGCLFGPDMAGDWLAKQKLPFLIRSHMCFPEGLDEVFCNNGATVITVFSCSNYVNSGNRGSVLTFTQKNGSAPKLFTYYTEHDGPQRGSPKEGLPLHAQKSLVSVLTQHSDMQKFFLEYFATDSEGRITREEWDARCEELNSNLPSEERIDASAFFSVLDIDGDGRISPEEMTDYLKVAGKMDQRSIFKRKIKRSESWTDMSK